MTAETPAIFSLIPFVDADSLAPPDKGPYYVATRKGYMIHSRTHFGRVLVPASEASSLPETQPIFFHDIHKFDAALIGMAWNFFRNVWEQKHSEAMVDITYSEEKGYRLFVPPQEATGGGVECKRNMEHYRGQIVGTIHSHCNFNAYHSGTDQHDANDHDGIHITIGNVDQPKPSVAVMFSASKIQWDLKLEQVMIGDLELVPSPEWWVNQVSDPKPKTIVGYNWQGKKPTTNGATATRPHPSTNTPSTVVRFPKSKKFYDLNELLYVESGLTETEMQTLFEADEMIQIAVKLLETIDIDMDMEFEQAVDSKRKDYFAAEYSNDDPDLPGMTAGVYDPDDIQAWRTP